MGKGACRLEMGTTGSIEHKACEPTPQLTSCLPLPASGIRPSPFPSAPLRLCRSCGRRTGRLVDMAKIVVVQRKVRLWGPSYTATSRATKLRVREGEDLSGRLADLKLRRETGRRITACVLMRWVAGRAQAGRYEFRPLPYPSRSVPDAPPVVAFRTYKFRRRPADCRPSSSFRYAAIATVYAVSLSIAIWGDSAG